MLALHCVFPWFSALAHLFTPFSNLDNEALHIHAIPTFLNLIESSDLNVSEAAADLLYELAWQRKLTFFYSLVKLPKAPFSR
jgi:hypothetical protein